MTDDAYLDDLAPESVQRTAALLHASALVGLCTGLFFLGPLVMWLLKRDEHPEFDAAGRAALNFHFTMLIAFGGAALLSMIFVGIPLLFLIGIASVVLPLVAAVRTANGEPFEYPFSIRFLK